MAMQSNIEQYSATRRNPHCLCGSAQSLCGSSQSSICVAQRSAVFVWLSAGTVFVWLTAEHCSICVRSRFLFCVTTTHVPSLGPRLYGIAAITAYFPSLFPPAHFPSLCPRLYGIAAITAYFPSPPLCCAFVRLYKAL